MGWRTKMAKAKSISIPDYRGQFGLIVSDPPWRFQDQLSMSAVRRGSSAQYGTMSLASIVDLDVQALAAPDCVLALWVPSSLLADGLQVMKEWGFAQKQIYTWVKTAQHTVRKDGKKGVITEHDGNGLAFGMGHYFRGCTEHALIGTRGKPQVLNKSQRNAELALAMKHSAKPEGLQDRLSLLFPDVLKLEMFARREREGWICTGRECPSTLGQDIQTWIKERLPAPQLAKPA